MKDIPIIFSAPMIRALLDGRKTMTRRLAWREVGRLDIADPADVYTAEAKGWTLSHRVFDGGSGSVAEPCAMLAGIPSPWHRVQPGDRLWVRESLTRGATTTAWKYAADDKLIGLDWPDHKIAQLTDWALQRKRDAVPSIHMPRWANRTTLTVTTVKIERLQDISPDDAWDEGVDRHSRKVRQMWLFGAGATERVRIYKQACVWEFEELWNSLHGDGSWESNPEIVALAFTVVQRNIDQTAAA